MRRFLSPRKQSWPLILLAAVSLAVFAAIRTFHLALFGSDNLYQAYPWYQKIAQSLHAGYVPWWDAGTYGGHPLAGDFAVGLLYPPNLLFCWLFGTGQGIGLGWLELLMILHFFVASLGMYLLARRWRLGAVASVVTGLVYAFSGAVLLRSAAQSCIFFGLALIPLGIYFFDRYLADGRKRYLGFSGIVFGLMILAGHLQPFLHGLLILGAYAGFSVLNAPRRTARLLAARIGAVAAVIAVAAVVAVAQLAAGAQYLPGSLRWLYQGYTPFGGKESFETFAHQFILGPSEFLNLINPIQYPVKDFNYLFIGLPPLVLLAGGVARWRTFSKVPAWREHRGFLLSIIGFGVLAVIGYYGVLLPHLLYNLPGLEQIRELGRYVILIHFGLSLLVGIAIQALLEDKRKGTSWIWLLGGSSIVAYGLFFGAGIRLALMLEIILAGGVIIAIAVNRFRKHLPVVIVGAVAMTVLLNVILLTPTDRDFPSPTRYYSDNAAVQLLARNYGEYRAIVNDESLPPNIADVYRLQTVGGYGPTVLTRYADFLQVDRTRLRLEAPYDSKALDALGVRYIIGRQTLPLREVLRLPDGDVRVYERPHPMPKLFTPADLNRITGPAGSVDFTTTEYGDLVQRYSVNLRREGQVVLTELWYPGWQAFVDGRRVTLEPFAGTTPAVLESLTLPAGTHDLTLRYEPFQAR